MAHKLFSRKPLLSERFGVQIYEMEVGKKNSIITLGQTDLASPSSYFVSGGVQSQMQ